MDIKKWLRDHSACAEGYKWAIENCQAMQEIWDTAKPEWLCWVALQDGVLTASELHEFGLWCAEQVRHLMVDPRSIVALEVKRKWIDGDATDDELAAARLAADSAADSAADWLRKNTRPNFQQ